MILSLSIVLAIIALYGIATDENIIKSILFLNIIQTSVILIFLSINYKSHMIPPIFPGNKLNMVDPTPQALMITAIVVGLAITSLTIAMSHKIFHIYGSLKWKDILREAKDD
ncbi:MAG: cation:proton antiporter subunit C [Peptostreptococcaceae bacterium]|jgi:multicomponent Na+:H+ antiporter subunit C|nr:cation:proton antiporter subunit C [Peptostreptococcaceae bacterium]